MNYYSLKNTSQVKIYYINLPYYDKWINNIKILKIKSTEKNTLTLTEIWVYNKYSVLA